MDKIFVPHEIKTLTVDTEKKSFCINGEEFGKQCTGFIIHCNRYDEFKIVVEIDTTLRFVNIERGQCVSDEELPNRHPGYTAL